MKTIEITITQIANGFVATGSDMSTQGPFGQPASTPTVFYHDIDELAKYLPAVLKETLNLDKPDGKEAEVRQLSLAFDKDNVN